MELKDKPWRALADEDLPREVSAAAGMLLPIERKLLWWLGRNYWSGDGAIIDAGAFCGASAVCFAAGLRENAAHAPETQSPVENQQTRQLAQNDLGGKRPVISYDKFVVTEPYTADFIAKYFGREASQDDSFLDLFEKQTEPYNNMIVIKAGDFLAERWINEPVEILFVDICKTTALNNHLVGEFFCSLIPGRSVVVQQDFHGVWLPQIHWTMQYFKDYFEIIDYNCGPSRVYLLTKSIPETLIDDIRRDALSLEKKISLLQDLKEDATKMGDARAALMAEVLCLRQLAIAGAYNEYENYWRAFAVTNGVASDPTSAALAGCRGDWLLEGAVHVHMHRHAKE